MLKFVQSVAGENPLIICGDFNAEPTEPVYSTIINCSEIELSSAYADMVLAENEKCSKLGGFDENDGASKRSRVDELAAQEPPFTTWKIREDGEVCHTIDYVFYSLNKFKVIKLIFHVLRLFKI